MDKLRIFISSTMQDLQSERKAVTDAINKNRFWQSVNAESFVARSESPREVCLEEIRKSHIYIGIFKNCYGYIPKNNNPEGYSVTALEYYEARNNKLPIFIFVYKNAKNREEKLKEFLKEITDFDTGHWRKEYYTIKELIKYVIDAINSEITKEYVENNNSRKKTHINEIYKLPYFKNLKKRFKYE